MLNDLRLQTMKNRNEQLASRLKEVLLDGKWIANTNYKEQLQDLDWNHAIKKVNNLNTIAALTFHINYYLAGLIEVFKGGELLIRDQYSFDMKPFESEQDWFQLRDDFLRNAEQFIELVLQMEDSIFDKAFVNEKYGTYLRNIEGVIEHCYYHLGQISLIKKIIN